MNAQLLTAVHRTVSTTPFCQSRRRSTTTASRSSVCPATGSIAVSTPSPRRAALTQSGPHWTSTPVNVSLSVASNSVNLLRQHLKFKRTTPLLGQSVTVPRVIIEFAGNTGSCVISAEISFTLSKQLFHHNFRNKHLHNVVNLIFWAYTDFVPMCLMMMSMTMMILIIISIIIIYKHYNNHTWCCNCSKTVSGSSAVCIGGQIEAPRVGYMVSGGDIPRSHCGRKLCPSPPKF